MNRYAASGLESEFEPGSRGRVLRNKLGIRRVRDMEQVESKALIDAQGDDYFLLAEAALMRLYVFSANGLRIPSTADELAAARRIDFARVFASRNQGFCSSRDGMKHIVARCA